MFSHQAFRRIQVTQRGVVMIPTPPPPVRHPRSSPSPKLCWWRRGPKPLRSHPPNDPLRARTGRVLYNYIHKVARGIHKDPFRAGGLLQSLSFWGQTIQIESSFPPKRGWLERVERPLLGLPMPRCIHHVQHCCNALFFSSIKPGIFVFFNFFLIQRFFVGTGGRRRLRKQRAGSVATGKRCVTQYSSYCSRARHTPSPPLPPRPRLPAHPSPPIQLY